MKLQAVKGTRDILPNQQAPWHHVIGRVGSVMARSGVREIDVPIFEHTEVFTRSAGASSDLVVQKEMYTFTDRGGRSITLRPEFTGGVLRAFIEHGMVTWPTPVKLWSHGPIFRGEQVQRGRYRQFHQVNCELVGLSGPLIDAEAISLLYDALRACGLKDLVVRLGSVGDPEDRARHNHYLREALSPHREALSEASKIRLELNPLRLWDSKDPGDRKLLKDLTPPLEHLSGETRDHFEGVKSYLDDWGIPVEVDPAMVRALDYYRRTAFEIHHSAIGAQSALAGGGRYDGLIGHLGGPDLPGVGWAFGVDRVLDALTVDEVSVPAEPGPDLFLIPLDEEAVVEVARLARCLRAAFRVEHAYRRRNPGRGLRDAERSGAPLAGLRGASERETHSLTVKDLASGKQCDILEDNLPVFLRKAGRA